MEKMERMDEPCDSLQGLPSDTPGSVDSHARDSSLHFDDSMARFRRSIFFSPTRFFPTWKLSFFPKEVEAAFKDNRMGCRNLRLQLAFHVLFACFLLAVPIVEYVVGRYDYPMWYVGWNSAGVALYLFLPLTAMRLRSFNPLILGFYLGPYMPLIVLWFSDPRFFSLLFRAVTYLAIPVLSSGVHFWELLMSYAFLMGTTLIFVMLVPFKYGIKCDKDGQGILCDASDINLEIFFNVLLVSTIALGMACLNERMERTWYHLIHCMEEKVEGIEELRKREFAAQARRLEADARRRKYLKKQEETQKEIDAELEGLKEDMSRLIQPLKWSVGLIRLLKSDGQANQANYCTTMERLITHMITDMKNTAVANFLEDLDTQMSSSSILPLSLREGSHLQTSGKSDSFGSFFGWPNSPSHSASPSHQSISPGTSLTDSPEPGNPSMSTDPSSFNADTFTSTDSSGAGSFGLSRNLSGTNVLPLNTTQKEVITRRKSGQKSLFQLMATGLRSPRSMDKYRDSPTGRFNRSQSSPCSQLIGWGPLSPRNSNSPRQTSPSKSGTPHAGDKTSHSGDRTPRGERTPSKGGFLRDSSSRGSLIDSPRNPFGSSGSVPLPSLKGLRSPRSLSVSSPSNDSKSPGKDRTLGRSLSISSLSGSRSPGKGVGESPRGCLRGEGLPLSPAGRPSPSDIDFVYAQFQAQTNAQMVQMLNQGKRSRYSLGKSRSQDLHSGLTGTEQELNRNLTNDTHAFWPQDSEGARPTGSEG